MLPVCFHQGANTSTTPSSSASSDQSDSSNKRGASPPDTGSSSSDTAESNTTRKEGDRQLVEDVLRRMKWRQAKRKVRRDLLYNQPPPKKE